MVSENGLYKMKFIPREINVKEEISISFIDI